MNSNLGIAAPPLPSEGGMIPWSEFLALCEKLKQMGKVPILLGARTTPWAFTPLFDYVNFRLNGPEFRNRLLAGNETWLDPRVGDVFKALGSLFDKGYVNSNWLEIDAWSTIGMMLNGEQYGMTFFIPGVYSSDMLRDNLVSWFPFPKMKDGVLVGEMCPTDGVVMAARAATKSNFNATIKMVSTIGSAYFQNRYVQDSFWIPSHADALATKIKNPMFNHSRFLDAFLMIRNADSLGMAFDIDTLPEFANPAMDLLLEWSKNRQTIQQTMQSLERLRLEVYVGLVSQPLVTPSSGMFTHPIYVNLTAVTTGSVIYYTTDGSVPTTDSEVYTGPILIALSGRTLLQAFADKKGMLPSKRLQVAFTLDLSSEKQVISLSSGAEIGSQVAAAFGLLIVIIVSVLSMRYQDTPVFRSSTPLFMQMMLVGASLVLSSVFVISQELSPSARSVSTSKALCNLQAWMLGLGFVLCMSCLVLKTWRISKIFGNTSLSVMQIPNQELLRKVGAMMLIEIIINALWTGLDPLRPTLISLDTTSQTWSCRSDFFFQFMGVSVGYKALILIAATYLAIRTREVPSAFNESKQIGFAIYNTAFLASMSLPLSFVVTLLPAHALRMIGILVSSIVSVIIFFGPKLYIAMFCPELNKNQTVAGKTAMTLSAVSTLSHKELTQEQCKEIASLFLDVSTKMQQANADTVTQELDRVVQKIATLSSKSP